MNNKLFSATLLGALSLLVVCSASAHINLVATGTWQRNDQGQQYHLKISKSSVPGIANAYKITYTTPNATNDNIMTCPATSATVVDCGNMGKVTLTPYNGKYKAIFDENYRTTIYYRKGQQPEASVLTGTWQKSQDDQTCANSRYVSFTMPYAEPGSIHIYGVSIDKGYGSNPGSTADITQDADSENILLTIGKTDYSSGDNFYLLDASGNKITSLDAVENAQTIARDLYGSIGCSYSKQ